MSQDDPPFEFELPPCRSKSAASGRIRERIRIELAFIWETAKKWSLRVVFIALHIALVLGAFYTIVWWAARDGCYTSVDKVPVRMVGLVLGCVKEANGRPNQFFTTRIDAAAELFKAGKVQYLLVSGDNHKQGYDEPNDMKDALIAKGVPADHIYCDYAGLRTLDSIVRTKQVFGQEDCTIVSQRFHNERALYIARRTGMPDAVAFDAGAANVSSTFMMNLREVFARMMAVVDVEFLRTQPKFLGKHISIGPKDPPVDAPRGEPAKKQ